MNVARNFIGETYFANHDGDGRREYIKKCYDEVSTRFSLIHVLMGMAHTETLKAIDMIEDMGLRVRLIKKYANRYEKNWKRYNDVVKENLDNSAWCLLQDYVVVSYSNAERNLIMLKLACHDYLNKLKVEKAGLLGQSEAALLMWEVAHDTFVAYFESFRKKCGADFSRDFQYANPAPMFSSWMDLCDELARGCPRVDFGDDKRCMDSWRALKNLLENEDFVNDSALEAMKLNKEIYERHKDEIESVDKGHQN